MGVGQGGATFATDQVLLVRQSFVVMQLFLGITAVLAVGVAWAALAKGFDDPGEEVAAFFIGGFIVISAEYFRRRIVRLPDVPLSLGPDGFRYYQLGADPIPWNAVRDVWSYQNGSLTAIRVSLLRARVPGRSFGWWADWMSRNRDVVSFDVDAFELKILPEALVNAFLAYRAAHG